MPGYTRKYQSRYRNQNYSNGFDNNDYGFGKGDFSDFGNGISEVDWSTMKLDPIIKDFYSESSAISKRSSEEISEFRSSKEIKVNGDSVPAPFQTFADYKFPTYISNEFTKQNFSEPTPIQAQSWPIALSGKDMVGIAQTGSGKTLGYILPGIIHLNHQICAQKGNPVVLILAPTRELTQQILVVARDFGKSSRIRSVSIYGGAAKYTQIRDLERGVGICIATPGRLLDLIQCGHVSLNNVSYLVLDEADRMLDMGFEPQIRKVIGQTRPDRQTLMFSATWPTQVRKLAQDFLKDYTQVIVGSVDLAACHNILQIVDVCREVEKEEKLLELLCRMIEEAEAKILIFASTKIKVDRIHRGLTDYGIRKVGSIHGDKNQFQRDSILNNFRNGKCNILVATDVAGRGLDVDGVKFVINFDFANNTEDYVHRIGRTGRQGKEGVAYTFFTRRDASHARHLIAVLKEANQVVNPDLERMTSSSNNRKPQFRGGRGGNKGHFNWNVSKKYFD